MMKRVYSLVIVGALVGGAALMIGPSLYASEPSQGNPVRTMAAVTQTVANAPISQSALVLGLSSDQMITRLRQKGIAVESPTQSLADVARKSNKSAPQLFAMILPQQSGTPEKKS